MLARNSRMAGLGRGDELLEARRCVAGGFGVSAKAPVTSPMSLGVLLRVYSFANSFSFSC